MRPLLFTAIIIISFLTTSFGQTNTGRDMAETSVKNYMSAKSKTYSPLQFGEFFSQYYSQSLQKLAKTNDTIKYSIVHTYMLKNKKITNTYFHINKSYAIIGVNTMVEINNLGNDDLKNNPKFDSILKSLELELKDK